MFEKIPIELKNLHQWTRWQQDGSVKFPCDIDGNPHSATDPDNWCSYQDAVDSQMGIGFCFEQDGGIVGIDLDNVIDAQQNLSIAAQSILNKFTNTYIEVSPSGTGVKIFCKAKIQLRGNKAKLLGDETIEIYNARRFFTMTGQSIGADTVSDCQSSVEWLVETFFPKPNDPSPKPTIENHNAEIQRAIDALQYIKDNDDYDNWYRVGMGLHKVDSSDEMLEQWKQWSKSSPKYNRKECEKKWASFTPDGQIGMGTLIHMAREDSGNGLFRDEKPQPDFSHIRKLMKPISVEKPNPIKVDPLLKKGFGLFPCGLTRPPEIWKGMLYQGKVGILAAESKSFKSWWAIAFGLSVAGGIPFLEHDTTKSNVLYVDFEVGGVFLSDDRINPVMNALKLNPNKIMENWSVLDLEGSGFKCDKIIKRITRTIKNGNYGLCIIDPYYMLALGYDENDNSKMAEVGAKLNKMARSCGCALMMIHHFTKGASQGKSNLDKGSGAGVICGRNPSLSLALSRIKGQENCFELDGGCRLHKKAEKKYLRWKYPLLEIDNSLANEAIILDTEIILKTFETPMSIKAAKDQIRTSHYEFKDSYFRELLEKCVNNGSIVKSTIKGKTKPITIYSTVKDR